MAAAVASAAAATPLSLAEDAALARTSADPAAASELLLLYLVAGDLESARHTWKRASAAEKEHGELQQAWAIASHLWKRADVPGAYAAIDAGAWSGPNAAHVGNLRAALQRDNFRVVCAAYGSVRPEEAGALLGCSGEDAAARCVASGAFALGDHGLLLRTAAAPAGGAAPAAAPEADGAQRIAQLAEYVTFLEDLKA